MRMTPERFHFVLRVHNGKSLVACKKDSGSLAKLTNRVEEVTCFACLDSIGARKQKTNDEVACV